MVKCVVLRTVFNKNKGNYPVNMVVCNILSFEVLIICKVLASKKACIFVNKQERKKLKEIIWHCYTFPIKISFPSHIHKSVSTSYILYVVYYCGNKT